MTQKVVKLMRVRLRCALAHKKKDCFSCKATADEWIGCQEWKQYLTRWERLQRFHLSERLIAIAVFETVMLVAYDIIPEFLKNPEVAAASPYFVENVMQARTLLPFGMVVMPMLAAVVIYYEWRYYKKKE